MCSYRIPEKSHKGYLPEIKYKCLVAGWDQYVVFARLPAELQGDEVCLAFTEDSSPFKPRCHALSWLSGWVMRLRQMCCPCGFDSLQLLPGIHPGIAALDGLVMAILGLVLSRDICSPAFAAWLDVVVSMPCMCINRAIVMPVLHLDKR